MKPDTNPEALVAAALAASKAAESADVIFYLSLVILALMVLGVVVALVILNRVNQVEEHSQAMHREILDTVKCKKPAKKTEKSAVEKAEKTVEDHDHDRAGGTAT